MSRPSTRHKSGATAGYDEAVRRSVGLIVAALHASGDSGVAVREKVRLAAREALEGEGEWERYIDTGTDAPEKVVSTAGVFRLVLAAHGIDRSDPWSQETFYDDVRKAIEPALTDAAFGIDTSGD